jgi:signal transduction histidine kinase/ActR/RegA family two-component response regulator
MRAPEHFVQFYESDEFLLNSLSGYVHQALNTGEAAIVVATEAHRLGLEARLLEAGLDVAAAVASGQYIALDAAATLEKFMVDDAPEPGRFVEAMESVIGRAAGDGQHLRVFGEMVALLWAEGNFDGAIRLEELWNDLLKRIHSFSLFCAYPMNGFGREELAGQLGNVCSGHSRVIPAESYTGLTDADARLRAITLLQQKARSLEAEVAERKEAEKSLRAVKEELEQELKQREQLLVREQAARAEAESASRLKDEFLATVSHELRTPLNAIIGWSHLLRNNNLDETKAARAIETIERNARAQAQLVEDILDVSRVITGKLRLNMEPVDAFAVINAAIDSAQLAADSKEIQLAVILDPSARRVSGDAIRLQQIVWNLLSNAIKFTPSGGRVEIRLERVETEAQIRVSDTGQGISQEFLPFIFDRFRQADGTSTRRHGGLGLGLAIVRHLVELHGGTVRADSPGEGLGSTFSVRLPLAPAAERAQARRSETGSWWPDEQAASRRSAPLLTLDEVQVLLVDDDLDTLQMLTMMLTAHGAKVKAVPSVAEALETMQWHRPDVLVSDLAMPYEDGYSLISKVRAMEAAGGKAIPTVALTAYVRVEDRARALSAGFNMFVPKPVEPQELIAVIANLAEPCESKFGLD